MMEAPQPVFPLLPSLAGPGEFFAGGPHAQAPQPVFPLLTQPLTAGALCKVDPGPAYGLQVQVPFNPLSPAPAADAGESVSLLIPGDRVSRVIGKQGSGLRQIREACGQKVEAKPEDFEASDGGKGNGTKACRLTLTGIADQICVGFAVALRRAYPEETPCTANVRIPSEWAGRVIGKGGEKLREVRVNCGVNVQVFRDKVVNPTSGTEERAVTLQGPTDKLHAALQILLRASDRDGGQPPAARAPAPGQPLPIAAGHMAAQGAPGAAVVGSNGADEVQLQLPVPDDLAYTLLGLDNGNITNVGAQTGCAMHVFNRAEGDDQPHRVVITGPLENVLLAQHMLHDQQREAYMASGVQDTRPYAATMFLRKEACGAVIGKQGVGITRLREQTGVKILLSDSEVNGLRPCNMEGLAASVMQAERLIHDIVREVPSQGRASPVGRALLDGGFSMLRLGAKRALGDAAGGAGEAPLAKRRRADDDGPQDPDSETRMLVPDQCAGLVIGKQGSNLKSLRENYGVKIEVLHTDKAPQWAGERLVVITGAVGSRALAVEHILRMTQQHSSQSAATASFKMLIPAAKVTAAIGEDGSNLKWLHSSFGVNPVIEPEEVQGEHAFTVYGAPAFVLEASKQIVAMLDLGVRHAAQGDAGPAQYADMQGAAPQGSFQPGFADQPQGSLAYTMPSSSPAEQAPQQSLQYMQGLAQPGAASALAGHGAAGMRTDSSVGPQAHLGDVASGTQLSMQMILSGQSAQAPVGMY
mmetsp:Transcript_31678/g.89265  ORF Transcript_31678/g.89265 Transcript_31678/m.89265 type:complete len:755 (-) Transcript_31678:157-2421(-)